MGHGITETDQMFSVREMPWHGLGVILSDSPTREEAQQLITPWEAIEAAAYKRIPVITESGDLTHEYVEIEGTKVIERSDNGDTLGVPNDTYGLVTNQEFWDVAEAVGMADNAAVLETGGTLNGGRNVWALMRFAEPLHVKGDPNGATIAHLAMQNSHDGSSSFRAQAVNTRIVCANTSAAADAEAKRGGYEFTFRHSKNVGDRIEDAKAAVAMWREGVVVWQNAMEHLVTIKVTKKQRDLFVEKFQPMPPENRITERVRNNVEDARDELRSLLSGPTTEGVDLTAYGLFQAGIEWAGHVRGVRGKDERSRMESYFKRNMLTDSGLRAATLELAMEVANA